MAKYYFKSMQLLTAYLHSDIYRSFEHYPVYQEHMEIVEAILEYDRT